MDETIKLDITNLRNESNIAYVASVDEEGYPLIKAMLVLEREGMQTQYFSTNYSSKRVQQFLKNPKASVYYCDEGQYKGALFIGSMEVCRDHDTKAFLWREGFEKYYPKGVDDEDYCVLKFTADVVNYFPGHHHEDLPVEDL
jgi:general stress protein 26